ncbi:hypothetical protein [Paenibacillus sp. HB172176]|uniref:hypothetical protein n=1 Tax=Paenibacillus sp. HB172176 TaxID=2493690 RepID=UPI00143BB440|nr:hypothetical protein [Paenibacillus sp. HB172176]
MNLISLTAACLLLFCLLQIALYSLFVLVTGRQELRGRLTHRKRKSRLAIRLASIKAYDELRRHLAELLETLRMSMLPETFLGVSSLLLLFGIIAGGLFFQTAKGLLLFGFAVGFTPYLSLRTLLIHRRMQAQIDFLPAVELFYQCYLVTGERQVRIALQRAVEERRLIGGMQAVFEQLYRNLTLRGDDESSLKLLSSSLGHAWADYFANMLHVALTEGVSISDNLRELLGDMRGARRTNEQERHKLLEIRIANFTPIFFLALFIGINIRYNSANAYLYYVQDAHGRDMLLNAIVLIFLSFLMGLSLSRKKM